MARKQTYKNEGGQVSFTFRNGRPPIFIPAGGKFETSDEEEQTAVRKSGQFSVVKKKEKK